MPVKALDATDRLVACLAAQPVGSHIRDTAQLNCFLGNGHIEGGLKTLLGVSWESSSVPGKTRAYLMDKNCGELIDLVAFEEAIPAFWLETKSSFLDRLHDGKRTAKSAMKQVRRYCDRIDDPLQGLPAYVVHFLGALPDCGAMNMPKWALHRFERLRRRHKGALLENAKILEAHYAGLEGYDGSIKIQIFSDTRPVVMAIVTKVKVQKLPRLGFIYKALEKKDRCTFHKTEGVSVLASISTSTAAEGNHNTGLSAKDIVLTVNKISIDKRKDFYQQLASNRGQPIVIGVFRNGKQADIHMTVPAN